MAGKNTKKNLGVAFAVACLVFSQVYLNINWDAHTGFHVASGLTLINQFTLVVEMDHIYLIGVIHAIVCGLAAVLLLVAALKGEKSNAAMRVLCVALPLVVCIFELIYYAVVYHASAIVFRSLPSFIIQAVAFVVLSMAIVLGKRNENTPIVAACVLSLVALVMLVVGVDPFGYSVEGGTAVRVVYLNTFFYYVTLWFGVAFVPTKSEAVPRVAQPRVDFGPENFGPANGGQPVRPQAAGVAPAPAPRCPGCGAPIDGAAKFCRECGRPLR